MVKKLLFAFLCVCSGLLYAQTDIIAFTINGVPTYKQELADAFKEYKATFNPDITIKEFIKSEIDRKIKVAEAKKIKIDTGYVYLGDYLTVRSKIQKKYLNTDLYNLKEAEEVLLERFNTELEVNQAFIPFDTQQLLPKDTLAYYVRAEEARDYALQHGFSKFERENKVMSFGIKLNPETENGYVGWIGPFMFSDNLETVLYSLKDGEISQPVRGSGGYHVLQVVGKRPLQGNPIVEAVLFNFPQIPAPPAMVDSVYQVAQATYNEIEQRGNFQQICNEFLSVMNTGQEDCLLGEISIQAQIPYPIIKAAFELEKPGEVSKPILGDFGYYILRLKEKRPPKSKEDIKEMVKAVVQTDYFKALNYKQNRKQLIDSFDIKLNPEIYAQILNLAAVYSPVDSLFAANIPANDEPFLIMRDTIFFQAKNFKDYLNLVKGAYEPPNKEGADPLQSRVESIVKYSLSSDILEDILNSYMYAAVIQIQKEDLENTNVEYKKIMSKFQEELLYTNFLNEQIWKKSRNDTDGLEVYFNEHRQKYRLEKPRFKGWLVFAEKQEVLDEIETAYNLNPEKIGQVLKSYKEHNRLEIIPGSWKEGDDLYVDYLKFAKEGKTPKGRYPYYIALGEIINTPKDYLDVYFEVEKDYQTYLEGELDKQLKEDYKVEVFNKVVNSIK